jgi:hypothetical protein
MDKRVQNLKSSSTFSRPTRLDTKTWSFVEPILEALQQAQHQTGRFKFYGYLAALYRTFKEWKDLGISKRMARRVPEYFNIPHRKGISLARTLIDATFPALDPKQKSRWSRALEFAALKGNSRKSTKTLQEFFGDCWLRPVGSKTKAEKEHVQG